MRMDIIFLYLILINVLEISSTDNTTFNCGIDEKYILDHGCTCGYFGIFCSQFELNLEGQGLQFLNLLGGNFSSIESLYVSANEESFTIPSRLFTPFENLRNLRIHNCNVVDIETGAFRNLSRLETLEISGNSYLTFDSITNGLSQLNSPNLEVLNISGNHNAENLLGAFIRAPLFESLSDTSLKVLDVSWTRLSILLAPFTLLPHLEKLDISGTFLLGSPSCISTITTPRNISHLVIDHWPFFPRGSDSIRNSEEPHGLFKRGTLDDCKLVQYLSDRGCIITGSSIRTVQTRFIDLDSFFLDFSKDICLEENNIVNHIASYCKISKQIGVIFGYDKLKLFDMSHPDVLFDGPVIKPHMFHAMPSLTILRLAGFYLNKLNDDHIEKLFIQNKNLTELDISHNGLLHIPKNMFLENIYLEYLNLSWNKLTVFDPDLSVCVHLVSVDLRQNNLKHLNTGVIQHITSLGRDTSFNLDENELECECQLLHFIQQVNVSTIPFLCNKNGEARLITKNVSQEFVETICENSKYPGSNTALIIGLACAISAALVFVIIVIIICKRRKANKNKNTGQQNMPVVLSLTDWENIAGNPQRKPKFIVFLAYCSRDYQFVIRKIYHKLNDKLVQFLPKIDPNQIIVIYDKHFLAGIDIDEICRVAIVESHVTVAVVTENFLDSPWCNLEVKMAISSKVPLIPLFVTKCDAEKLTGFLRVVYEEKVRLLWPETSALDETLAEEEENKLLDTLCAHIMTYVKLHECS